MKIVRILVASVAALAIGTAVQIAVTPAASASAACVNCWEIIHD